MTHPLLCSVPCLGFGLGFPELGPKVTVSCSASLRLPTGLTVVGGWETKEEAAEKGPPSLPSLDVEFCLGGFTGPVRFSPDVC